MPRIILNKKENREERKVDLYSTFLIIIFSLFLIITPIIAGIGYNIATEQTKAEILIVKKNGMATNTVDYKADDDKIRTVELYWKEYNRAKVGEKLVVMLPACKINRYARLIEIYCTVYLIVWGVVILLFILLVIL